MIEFFEQYHGSSNNIMDLKSNESDSLIEFFEHHHDSLQISPNEVLDLEMKIKQAALLAGCMIDCHAMHQMRYCADSTSLIFPDPLIFQIMEELESTVKEADEVQPSRRLPEKTTMTGFGHHLNGIVKCFESIKEIAVKFMMDFNSNEAQLSPAVCPSYSMVVFDQHLIIVIKCFESIKEVAKKMVMDVQVNRAQRALTRPSALLRGALESHTTMVGFDKHLTEVKSWIKGHASTLQILPIVGTGGIGKTILVQNVYYDQLIKGHFDVRLWATISQSYNVQDILLRFLQDLKIAHHDGEIHELGVKLYKALFSRRYLVVMDDIWNVELWDKIRNFFPENGNGSRIIFTTRLLRMASYLGSCDPFRLEYIDQVESWNLLKKKVFGQDECPLSLEDVGRRIAKSCKGLPLAIVVIAGHLRKSEKTQESWENVARSLIPILQSENDSQCLKILSLSYDNLPIYLKPCFLYMAFFRESSELRISEMIKFWVADDLFKPFRNKSLEDTAVEYLTDLVERNLVSVSRRGSTGKIKCFRIHDLLRDICKKKAQEHQFLYKGIVKNDYTLGSISNIPLSKFSLRCYRFNLSTSDRENKGGHEGAGFNLWNFRSRHIQLSSSQSSDACTFSASLAILPVFPNLHTLVINETPGNEPVDLPPQIWEMQLLKHLIIKQVILPEPQTAENSVIWRGRFVLAYLQTLQDVYSFKLSEEVVKRIPNLKKLKITYTKVDESTVEWSQCCLHNLGQLCKLESLSFSVHRKINADNISLPKSLKKLSLDGCKLPWEDISMVGLLPNLEVLWLQNDAFCGDYWKPIEGEFCQLKALHLRNMSLELWEADYWHFPTLESLILYNVWRLSEIPPSIGEIDTLQFIYAEFCRFSLESSVRLLIKNQREVGNYDIEVELPRFFTLESGNSFDIMQYVRYFIYNLLHFNSNPIHETNAMIEKFGDNLRELQAFLSYTAIKEKSDERLKELVKHIRDVMYEAVDVAYTAAFQADKSESLSFSFRRILNVVKEVNCITDSVQNLLLSIGDGLDEEFLLYRDPSNLIDWETDDESNNFQILQMISQHKNKMDPDWLKKYPQMAKYLEPASSSDQFIPNDFAQLTDDVDGISVENEMQMQMKRDQISTVHLGTTCDYCEMNPIVGVRYKCKDCLNYGGFDLCQECYTSRNVSDHTGLHNDQMHTSEHKFQVLTSIKQRPR